MIYKVNEIFQSINGEVTGLHQGSLTTFIRLQGCNLRCRYCDTTYAIDSKGGTKMMVHEIIEKCPTKQVTITGGEPLEQDIEAICYYLRLHDKKITIETNGTYVIPPWPFNYISWVVDYKLEFSHLMKNNFRFLTKKDFLKFVIGNTSDMNRAVNIIKKNPILKNTNIAFSPINARSEIANIIVNIMKKENIDGILNLQIHKFLDIK